MIIRNSLLSFLLTISVIIYSNAGNARIDLPKIYKEQLFHLTEVMVTDVASPPVAARIYAYSTLATYLSLKSQNQSFAKGDLLAPSRITGVQIKNSTQLASPEFAAIYAMLKVGEGIMPSGYLLREKQENWISEALKSKIISKKNLQSHLDFSQEIADQILSIAKNDGYIQLTALTRYSPKQGEGNWYPTPPAYIAAIEPEWRTIQPFFLQDLDEFDPEPMAAFDLNEGSPFQIQLMEVFNVAKNLSEEQKLIANFWDCNPFMVDFSGHMAIGVKKISPGGHWMGITGIAAEKARLSFAETAYVHTLVGMTLHDAFISCWKAKYETDRIRPETVINRELDQRWRPLLQTPPFPEYTSGHSVISRASAIVLTGYFGDNFSFLDTSETYFGLPSRSFDSFLLASEEAAISRLYGGIHFRDAIEEGVKQGEKIGKSIWKSINQSELLTKQTP
ncbi:vanadium-dependent haloperoxidase [Algoriphagus sp. CAU 1675]|uniref:vanadium-dependent haloperoxidase n=1 Tax=Algoriphagus sp. CAU 1675 TaxID=3032597 RepID=UPI0023DB96CE|nr:vanadium-dependent haloperoxidase [Algoriphagus sp. CAU 1675]MDF2158295.1 vanadium-dependent haloperoxidase [Algoriphagus sp. CAU 1675]